MDWKSYDGWNFPGASFKDRCYAYGGWGAESIPHRAYYFTFQGTSKLANIMFTKELQRRFGEENVGIVSITLEPGDVHTGQRFPLGPSLLY